nr:lactate utilization protein C [Nocardioides flavescens]
MADVDPAARDLVPPPAPQVEPVDPAALLDRFVERVADYRSVVERCSDADVAAAVTAAVLGHVGRAGRIVVPEGLPADVVTSLEAALAAVVVDRPGAALSAYELDALDGVVTTAAVGVAETGTLVLDHGPGQGRRALSLVPDLHVCVVRAEQVVPDVADALARLDPLRPATWVSGPSATSDIELDRVEGVHGPRVLHVVVVDPA